MYLKKRHCKRKWKQYWQDFFGCSDLSAWKIQGGSSHCLITIQVITNLSMSVHKHLKCKYVTRKKNRSFISMTYEAVIFMKFKIRYIYHYGKWKLNIQNIPVHFGMIPTSKSVLCHFYHVCWYTGRCVYAAALKHTCFCLLNVAQLTPLFWGEMFSTYQWV